VEGRSIPSRLISISEPPASIAAVIIDEIVTDWELTTQVGRELIPPEPVAVHVIPPVIGISLGNVIWTSAPLVRSLLVKNSNVIITEVLPTVGGVAVIVRGNEPGFGSYSSPIVLSSTGELSLKVTI